MVVVESVDISVYFDVLFLFEVQDRFFGELEMEGNEKFVRVDSLGVIGGCVKGSF